MRTAIAVLAMLAAVAQHAPTDIPAADTAALKIERLDPALDALVAPEAKIEILARGFSWSEGPVWVKDGGYLLFSDIPQNVVFKWKEGEGVTEYLKPAGYTGTKPRGGESGSNALALDPR